MRSIGARLDPRARAPVARRSVVSQMADGIESSTVVLVFITRAYLRDVGGDGPDGLDDDAKAEFDYACHRKGVGRMLPIVLEAACTDTRSWRGAVGMRLGSQLYVDCSDDDALRPHSAQIAHLLDRIRSITADAAHDTRAHAVATTLLSQRGRLQCERPNPSSLSSRPLSRAGSVRQWASARLLPSSRSAKSAREHPFKPADVELDVR